MATYTIRTMTRDEVDFAVDMAAREGWNPGLGDAECFYRCDPEGFLVGLLDNRPIACISAVDYGNGLAFMGFYVVLPEFRGRGYGLSIFHQALERLRGRSIGGDAVDAQLSNYQKIGFVPAYRNSRFEGVSQVAEVRHPALRPVAGLDFDALVAYDAAIFTAQRRKFLECWLRTPRTLGLGWVEGGELRGYGVIRPCGLGWKIGPLFADRPDVADALFTALRGHPGPGERLFLDAPLPNAAAVALAGRYAMRVVFETTRIYLGPTPSIPLAQVFGVTSFELG